MSIIDRIKVFVLNIASEPDAPEIHLYRVRYGYGTNGRLYEKTTKKPFTDYRKAKAYARRKAYGRYSGYAWITDENGNGVGHFVNRNGADA